MQKMPAIVIKDEVFLEHDPGFGHPESPNRLKAIYERIAQDDLKGCYVEKRPRMATKEELSWNHSIGYIERIERTKGISHYQLDPDTSTSERSWEAACFAVGGVFEALDEIFDEKGKAALALVRPPGHHAEKDHAMGFCLFNNVALGAHYAIKKKGCKKVLIVDWDLHHGNGTQHSFYNSSDVLYFSTHQFPYYPGTGSIKEVGEGAGEGFTVNCPLSPGVGDEGYASIFNHLLTPIALEYRPDVILVSAGFDIYVDDPLGGMNVTGVGFGYLAQKLVELSKECCDGRILFALEGGYSLKGLKEGVSRVLMAINDNFQKNERKIIENLKYVDNKSKELLDVINFQKKFWKNLVEQ